MVGKPWEEVTMNWLNKKITQVICRQAGKLYYYISIIKESKQIKHNNSFPRMMMMKDSS